MCRDSALTRDTHHHCRGKVFENQVSGGDQSANARELVVCRGYKDGPCPTVSPLNYVTMAPAWQRADMATDMLRLNPIFDYVMQDGGRCIYGVRARPVAPATGSGPNT